MAIPFKCSKCGNWYTPIELQPNDTCPNIHAESSHCHYAERASTYSERMAAELHALARTAQAAIERGLPDPLAIASAEDKIKACERAMNVRNEKGFTKVELAKMYAGAIGLAVGTEEERWYNIDALAERVETFRRPQSDLDTARRSLRVTTETLSEMEAMLTQARVAVAAARAVQANQATQTAVGNLKVTFQDATTTMPIMLEHEEKKLAARERMAKARAARKATREVEQAPGEPVPA